ncbi:MAG: acetyl/propionyl/methylcrotonyl-CoA carboxylase subunit alpha [Desulfobulbaceae bacterium]|nr:acetyl/propionyl/methylcrotonyl-CoA carboxylase subunit alpha [Desulfobulbaceae bacterium]
MTNNTMFSKILIANRGEIACRIIKTAKAMSICTVAVYSDADRGALHVQMADEAVHIGPSPAFESYLVMEKIIAACKQTGAQAVHPGYGFLSENSTFCQMLADEGIVFIGPPAPAITAMGDKITSKKIALKAGVNTIPGHTEEVPNAEEAVHIAAQIGYPVMIKATAGGGGKGMRVAHNEAQCLEGFERASSEALSSFGDGRIFIEKFIENPRHIEIQILADSHGGSVYLGERECSIQRRHQKVIEEAPSPFLDDATRKAMGEQAVALGKAVDYSSAGTVEFVVDKNRNFYFLEMNTRLQVEHPVTELTTGLDLVEEMIKIAAGNPLSITQEDIKINGCSMECRVYAEDPFSGFLPSTGRLTRYCLPSEENEKVRVDTGVFEGGEISIYYDPMIAKLVTYGEDREEATSLMREALDEYVIRGVKHNIGFLGALMNHPKFISGDFTTNFIAQEYGEDFNAEDVIQQDPALPIVVAAIIHRLYMDRAAHLSGQLQGYERRVQDNWVVISGGEHYEVLVTPFQPDGGYRVIYQGKSYSVLTDWSFCQPLFRGNINGRQICFQVERYGITYRLLRMGGRTDAKVMTPLAADLHRLMPLREENSNSQFLQAPMPGLLIKLSVVEGQSIRAGDELAIIEAMKMENILRAPHDGMIKKISTQVGDSLNVDQVILEFS